jgi:hypothetical protein
MKRYIRLLILVVAILALGYAITEEVVPRLTQQWITHQIDEANYCSVASDCVDAGGKCPFGCYNYVNAVEVERISALLDNYESECVYGCVRCPQAACIDGSCVPKCDD